MRRCASSRRKERNSGSSWYSATRADEIISLPQNSPFHMPTGALKMSSSGCANASRASRTTTWRAKSERQRSCMKVSNFAPIGPWMRVRLSSGVSSTSRTAFAGSACASGTTHAAMTAAKRLIFLMCADLLIQERVGQSCPGAGTRHRGRARGRRPGRP